MFFADTDGLQGSEASKLAGEFQGRDQAGRLWAGQGLQCSREKLYSRSGNPLVQVKVMDWNDLVELIPPLKEPLRSSLAPSSIPELWTHGAWAAFSSKW